MEVGSIFQKRPQDARPQFVIFLSLGFAKNVCLRSSPGGDEFVSWVGFSSKLPFQRSLTIKASGIETFTFKGKTTDQIDMFFLGEIHGIKL